MLIMFMLISAAIGQQAMASLGACCALAHLSHAATGMRKIMEAWAAYVLAILCTPPQ